MDILVAQLMELVESFHSGSLAAAAAAPNSSSSAAPAAAQSKSTASSATASAPDSEALRQQELIRNSPAVKFLTRTDFFSMVQYSDVSISFIFIKISCVDELAVCVLTYSIIVCLSYKIYSSFLYCH